MLSSLLAHSHSISHNYPATAVIQGNAGRFHTPRKTSSLRIRLQKYDVSSGAHSGIESRASKRQKLDGGLRRVCTLSFLFGILTLIMMWTMWSFTSLFVNSFCVS